MLILDYPMILWYFCSVPRKGGLCHIKTAFRQKPYRLLGIHLAVLGLLALDCVFGCPFKRIFGISCPGCGLTRAWLCFLGGDWRQAFQYNLLFLPTPLFIFLFAHRDTSLLPKSRLLDGGLIGFAAVLAGWYLWRLDLFCA